MDVGTELTQADIVRRGEAPGFRSGTCTSMTEGEIETWEGCWVHELAL